MRRVKSILSVLVVLFTLWLIKVNQATAVCVSNGCPLCATPEYPCPGDPESWCTDDYCIPCNGGNMNTCQNISCLPGFDGPDGGSCTWNTPPNATSTPGPTPTSGPTPTPLGSGGGGGCGAQCQNNSDCYSRYICEEKHDFRLSHPTLAGLGEGFGAEARL